MFRMRWNGTSCDSFIEANKWRAINNLVRINCDSTEMVNTINLLTNSIILDCIFR